MVGNEKVAKSGLVCKGCLGYRKIMKNDFFKSIRGYKIPVRLEDKQEQQRESWMVKEVSTIFLETIMIWSAGKPLLGMHYLCI